MHRFAVGFVNTVAQIDYDTGKGYVQAQRKIHCSLKDNDPVTYMWQGRAYARVRG